jgi:sugar O-acyltransferase (sialic acid O-acetyltransferase NeuD family)
VLQNNIIVGYSGHAYVVLESLLAMGEQIRFYSDKIEKNINPFDLEYLGNETDINFSGWNMEMSFILGIGNNLIREKIGMLISEKNKNLLNVVHPMSLISNKVEFGKGIFISKGAMINPLSKINDFVILNTGCIIEHECEIDQAAHVAPGAVLAGNVKVGKRSFVGANSVIKEGVIIGDDVIIGAGSVIIHNVPDGSKIVGNPGKNI